MKSKHLSLAAAGLVCLLSGCAPEVGSNEWCEDMDEKPKGDWTANEAKDFAEHCIFRSRDDDDDDE